MRVDRRSVFLLIACCFWGMPATNAKAYIADDNVAGTYFLEGVRANVEFRNGLKLDAYAPPGARRPAALLIHGSSGDKSTHLTQLFPLLTNAGYAWFSITITIWQIFGRRSRL
jgi:hypothetical protein